MRHMKRSNTEPWIENVGEAECLEPALKQNTNDDDFKNVQKLNIFYNRSQN